MESKYRKNDITMETKTQEMERFNTKSKLKMFVPMSNQKRNNIEILSHEENKKSRDSTQKVNPKCLFHCHIKK